MQASCGQILKCPHACPRLFQIFHLNAVKGGDTTPVEHLWSNTGPGLPHMEVGLLGFMPAKFGQVPSGGLDIKLSPGTLNFPLLEGGGLLLVVQCPSWSLSVNV